MGQRSGMQRREGRDIGFRKPDWVAVMVNIRELHRATQRLIEFGIVDVASIEIAELHDTVHHLARSLGASDEWLHEDSS